MDRQYTELWGSYQGDAWELIDTADEDNDIDTLLGEYQMAYGAGWSFELR